MSQVGFNTQGVGASGHTHEAPGTGGKAPLTSGTVLPPETSGAGKAGGSSKLDLPALPLPREAGMSLSLEQIFEALGMSERQTAVNKGVSNIKAKAEEIKNIHAKKLEQIQKQLDALKSKGFLDGFKKAFKWIGMALGAIGSIAALVGGIATGNPFLIAGGLIGLTMSIDAMVSEGTGGKHSIGAAITKSLVENHGMSESTAQKWAMGITMAITLIGAACSITGGLGSSVFSLAKSATDVAKTISTISTVVNIINAANSVAEGITGIVNATYDYEIAKAKAELKDLEAVLETLQHIMQSEEKLVEAMLERNQDLFGKVKDIVDGNIATQTAIVSGSPSMA